LVSGIGAGASLSDAVTAAVADAPANKSQACANLASSRQRGPRPEREAP